MSSHNTAMDTRHDFCHPATPPPYMHTSHPWHGLAAGGGGGITNCGQKKRSAMHRNVLQDQDFATAAAGRHATTPPSSLLSALSDIWNTLHAKCTSLRLLPKSPSSPKQVTPAATWSPVTHVMSSDKSSQQQGEVEQRTAGDKQEHALGITRCATSDKLLLLLLAACAERGSLHAMQAADLASTPGMSRMHCIVANRRAGAQWRPDPGWPVYAGDTPPGSLAVDIGLHPHQH